jgi:dephospho-CoA kinase
MLRVGLTGGIACGKSHVLRRLAARGLATLDLDAVAHGLMAPGGGAYAEVVETFGRGILAPDGIIDRKALGALVFADAGARARLDALVHPRVRAEEARRAAALEAEGWPALVSDAALLVEAGAHLRFDRLVVVHCSPEEQLRRLVQRDRIPEDAALARVAAQMPVGEKRRYAHSEIETSGTEAETEQAADALGDSLLSLAAVPRPLAAVPPERRLGGLREGDGPGPRGLDAAGLLEAALDAGGIELGRLARALTPPAGGPWYRAARPGEGAPWPEALAVPVALWADHAGLDGDWLAAAAASLARLTHADPGDVATAVLASLAALDVGVQGSLDGAVERIPGWVAAARRWGGGEPSPRAAHAIESAAAHPRDAVAARREAEARGVSPLLAGGLTGLQAGSRDWADDPRLSSLARRLG